MQSKMSMENKEAIDELSRIAKGGRPINPSSGLCSQPHIEEVDVRLLWGAFESWPEFSGNSTFPIPSYGKEDETVKYCHTHLMYNRLTKYGRARRRLAAHCAEYLSNAE
jgi:hypothetical protein